MYIKKQIWNKHLKNQTLPPTHPIYSMAATTITQAFSKRVDLLSRDMPNETPEPIAAYFNEPPWGMIEAEVKLDLPIKMTKADHPEALRRKTLEMLNTQYHSFVKIYTDGSVDLSLIHI